MHLDVVMESAVRKGINWDLKAAYAGVVGGVLICAGSHMADAREPGNGNTYSPGVCLGVPTGANPPPGVYLEEMGIYYAANTTAQGSSKQIGPNESLFVNTNSVYWTMPWTFLGATEMMFALVPVVDLSVTNIPALNDGKTYQRTAIANPIIAPINLSWNVAPDLFVSTVLTFLPPVGQYSPTATINVGNDFWTFQPQASLSYLGNGYDLTLHSIYSTNTQSAHTSYTSGDQLFIDVTATKKFGKWEVGPVGYFNKQITNDQNSGTTYGTTKPTFGNPEQAALGALAGYNFGPLTLTTMLTRDVEAADGGTQGTKFQVRLFIPLM